MPVSEVILLPLHQVEVIENESVNFVCLTRGVRPKATITWYIDDSVMAETLNDYELNGSLYDVNSTLTTSFQRKDMGKNITCSAVNIKNMQAVTSTATIINVLCEYIFLVQICSIHVEKIMI